eukprot:8690867-Pyramimonas_sp.AAC.1
MNGQLQAILNNPANLVLEVLHSAAFRGGLANQFLWSGTPVTSAKALDFVQKNITGPRVVVAASGCDHEDLLAVSDCVPHITSAFRDHDPNPADTVGAFKSV